MIKIKIDTFDVQVGSLGREFKLIGVKRGYNEKYGKNDWYYTFKYIDDNDTFQVYMNVDGKLTSIIKE